jgi:anti-sigma factor RsiW
MTWVRKRDEKTEHGYVEERLSAYLDGELTQQEQSIVERHLARCQDCRWNLDTLRQTVQWVQELPSVPVPRVFTIPVPAEPARAPRRRWGVPLLQGATALVALMLVFVVAGDFILTGPWSGLPLAAPGASEAAPTGAAAPDVARQVVVETLEVEATVLVEMEVETVVEGVAVEEEAPVAAVLESPAPEAEVAESPPPGAAESPAPTAEPSLIAERILEAKATLEAPAGESPTIVEVQTAAAKAEEEQTATPAPEPTAIPTQTSTPPPLPTPTAIPTVTPSPAQPLAAEEPTEVAIAPPEEPPAGDQEGVRATDWVEPTPAAVGGEAGAARPPRDPRIVWFGVTEISLAGVLVLLATVTIVVMIRQRRTR